MRKHNIGFRNANKLADGQSEDENKTKNQGNFKNDKVSVFGKPSCSLHHAIKLQSNPLTSYRTEIQPEEQDDKKWKLLTKFHYLASKAHYVHNLKFQTLFLSYSLAENTAEMVINESITYEYWVVCCLFMSMKYEEIYPPRLKDLSMLIKQAIKSEEYNATELKIFEFINLDLNFVSLNTYLSEFLHVTNGQQRYFLFYFLEIALNLRFQLKKFSLKELVLSVVFIFSSNRLHFYSNQIIDGVKFERIEDCSKFIVLGQTSAAERFPFLYKKYRSERMKQVSITSIPCIESLTALMMKKTNQEASTPKIIGLCSDRSDQSDSTIDEEINNSNDELISILENRAKYRMSE